MIKYCIPTSFDDRLIDKVIELNSISNNKICEFYGSTKEILTGSGRPSKILQDVSIAKLKKHIKNCHNNEIRFNFLLNGACMGGEEFNKVYLKKIIDFVSILYDSKVDILTISNPYLVTVIKNKFPKLNICLSIIAGVGNMQEIKIYEGMGINRIVLDANINRAFELLKSIRKQTNIKLEVLANNPCLLKCPFRRYHPEIDSHISIKEREIPPFPSIMCKNIRLNNFEEIIKSPWIRPFDAHRYTELGIDYIKLSGRGKNTEWIINLARHYLEEKDGANFYQFIEKNSWNFFHEKNKKLENLEISIPFLPNDFLDFFVRKNFDCDIQCKICGYCKRIAEQYVKVNNQKTREKYLKYIDAFIKKVSNPI